MTNAILSDAIASLQKRVQQLEQDNGSYRREISLLRLKINSATQIQTDNESTLLETADNTIQMLSSATETLKELRRIKHENRILIDEQRLLERKLGTILRKNSDIKTRISLLRTKIAESLTLQHEYDSLVLEVLTPSPLPQRDTKLSITFLHSSVTKETFSFPAKIQMLLQELQSLPSDFGGQRMDVKRRIIDVLAAAKETVDRLRDDIEILQSEAIGTIAQRRIRPIVEQKLNYIDFITQTMGRFFVDGTGS
jgi:chromosome segregation ATPase